MHLDERVERSKVEQNINFSTYQPLNTSEGLVELSNSQKLLVRPNWEKSEDWEGQRYADYINDHPEYSGVYVREELARRLLNAADSLGQNLSLVIVAGHRPIEVQKAILKDYIHKFRTQNPSVSYEQALAQARIFISDPDIELPPHTCGAAVDVEIINTVTGLFLDFGTNINDNNERSYLHHPKLTQNQKNNRLILLRAMLGQGFASYPPEWWHYSYGDQAWAWFYNEPNSLYSPVSV